MIFQTAPQTASKIQPSRIQTRPHPASNIWRQWERFTIGGIRLNNKRYSAAQGFALWIAALLALYLLRVIAMKKKEENELNEDDDPSQFWKGRHLIFCISGGRSGSKYLYNLFDACQNTRSFHEPNPTMTGDILTQVLFQGKRSETFEERSKSKLNAIRNELEATKPNIAYVETSHMFIKTFSDVILSKLGNECNITILSLHRPISKIISSQLELGWFQKQHSGLNNWYYDIRDLHSSERLIPLNGLKLTNTSVDQLIGYNLDILEREKVLKGEVSDMKKKGQWSNVQVIDVNVNQLSSSTNSITQFLKPLNIQPDQRRIQQLSNQDNNQRQLKKDKLEITSSLNNIERRVHEIGRTFPILKE